MCVSVTNQSNTTHEITQQISRKLLRMDILTSETCWAVNNEIIKPVTSSWDSLYSAIKMMHGPINIRESICTWFWVSLYLSTPLYPPRSHIRVQIRSNTARFQGTRKFKYRVSQEQCARLRDSVPNVKVYRYNPKHLYPKLNGYGDNGQRKVGASCGSKYCNLHSCYVTWQC